MYMYDIIVIMSTDIVTELRNGLVLSKAVHEIDLLPSWIKNLAEIKVARLSSGIKIYFLKTVKTVEFDVLMNLQNQTSKRFDAIVVLVADDLNPKFRPLLVKLGIPYIYQNQTVFIPDLGLKISKIDSFEKKINTKMELGLGSFEFRLIAGFLTGFLTESLFNLEDLNNILFENNFHCSKSKLSEAVATLVRLEYVSVEGKGPFKKVKFYNRKDVWEKVNYADDVQTKKLFAAYYIDSNREYVSAGETALAKMSDLSEPTLKHFALTNKEKNEIELTRRPIGRFGDPVAYFHVYKEQPELFSIKGNLNPLEIFLDLRSHKDERIQIALSQMLKNFKLERITDA